ncbi:MAG TPA: alpha/beta hydrolase domain-containing protein [Vicinamibacterales bacterium]|nr:alpha/beta hydrolase domain-containing protein [Vicinamibacterales bacterium]
MRRAIAVVVGVLACAGASARADVTRVEIAKRAEVQGSGYEKIAGTVHFAVNPADPRNAIIVDLDKAPRNAAGLVEFSSDFYILRPKEPARGNNSALVEVSNRGGRGLLRQFNRGGPQTDPETDADLGDKFLMRFGFTLAWVGWEFDVADTPGMMRIHVPAATDHGKTISGIVRAAFIPASRVNEFVLRDLGHYDAVDPDGSDTQLTVRSAFLGRGEVVPRQRWHVTGHTVTMDGGFEPGKTYEIAYRAENPPVAGLGFAAMRDFASWLKHADRRAAAPGGSNAGPIAPVRYAYAFGASQSGRYLRDFLYEGFNTDEHDRQVFDGVMAHIAGAARIDLNARWSTPIGLGVHSATSFPFADASMTDPISGAQEGAIDNARAKAHQPKIFYTNTPVEYWGTGRVAALIHTKPDGAADVTPPDDVRVYFLAGTQHSPGRFPPTVANGQQADNPVEYAWPLRALLLAMHRWVSAGTLPPASAFPKLSDGTLVKASAIGFPSIPGVSSPGALSAGWRAANKIIKTTGLGDFVAGAGAGAELPLLVPAVDADGNERAGIRLPDVAVPLGTYTGWNFRSPATGSPTELVSLLGSSIYFPATRAARDAAKDPRRSIEERYPSRDQYLAQIEKAADALVARGYLLIDDVPRIVQRASDTWDLVTTRPSTAR